MVERVHHTFEQHAVWLIDRLLIDISEWDVECCAACAGNGGGESQLQAVQEVGQKAPHGGYDWFQWTGIRRTQLVNFCIEKKLDIDSDEANYQFLIYELRGSEKRTVQAVKNAIGLKNKVIAFEQAFERAGIKNYDGRYAFALRALNAYNRTPQTEKEIPTKEVDKGISWWDRIAMFLREIFKRGVK